MSSENYYLIDDMKAYANDIYCKAYEEFTVGQLIPILRDYYNTHMPTPLTAWLCVNDPDDNLIYKKGQCEQSVFTRDTIMKRLFFYMCGKPNGISANKFEPMVVGTHMSKSVLLPVMEINFPTYGIKFLLRYNFYNWNVSVESDVEVDFDHKETIDDDAHKYCFCEGFPDDRIYGKYADNKHTFTICIDNDYDLYTFMYLMRDWLYTRENKVELNNQN